MAEVGELIRQYRIEEVVGRGGMATVYRVTDTNLEVERALKELSSFHASDPTTRERFRDEARIAASLTHPRIVTIHDHFVWDDTPYIVMEHFPLGDARALVLSLGHDQVASLLGAVLEGLVVAERAGVLHRDLKPDNLMRTAEGSVKITDFGIAKLLQLDVIRTRPDQALGSLPYIAPEVLRGLKPTPASDLYSVGVVAYEMLRGFPPFSTSESPDVFRRRKQREEAMPVQLVVPTLHIRFASWVDRLLRRHPEERFQRAEDALDALEEFAQREYGIAWKHVALPTAALDVVPPLAPAPPPSRFRRPSVLFSAATPAQLVRHVFTRRLPWLAAGIIAASGWPNHERWMFPVAGTAFLLLCSLYFFDGREAYLARGLGRRRQR